MYIIYICYNLCKIVSLQYIIANESNSGLEDDTSISSKSNTQIDRWPDRDRCLSTPQMSKSLRSSRKIRAKGTSIREDAMTGSSQVLHESHKVQCQK